MGTEGLQFQVPSLVVPMEGVLPGTVGLGPGEALRETRSRISLVPSVALGEGLTEAHTSGRTQTQRCDGGFRLEIGGAEEKVPEPALGTT